MSAYLKRIGTRLSAIFTGGVLMREQKLFMSAVSLFFIASSLSGMFVNTFIYSCAYESGEVASAIRAVVYYNLCIYIAMAFFSIVIGIIGKTLNSRKLICTGLILYAILYILLLVLGVQSIKFIWLLGTLSGIANSFFNLNYSSAVAFATTNESREYYLSLQGIINAVVIVITPLIAGILAELIGGIGGYITLFIITLIVLASSILHCFSLTYNDGKKTATQFGNVFVFSIKDKPMRFCALADVVCGLREGVVLFLVPIFLFSVNKSNAVVGVYLFICALIQVGMSNILNKFFKDKNSMGIAFLTCVLYALSGFLLFFGINVPSIFSYGILSALLQCSFVATVFNMFYKAAYRIPNAHRKNLEILSVREFYTNMGRIIGVFILMLVLRETTQVIYTIIIFGFLQIVSWIMLAYASKQLGNKGA